MQVNATTTNGIWRELQAQRNEALDKVALASGKLAEAQEALATAQKEIADLKIENKRLIYEAVDKPVAEAA